MKRIWIFLMAMLSIVSFTGCDMTEEPSGPVTVIDYEFDRTYIINNDGCCVFKGLKPVRAADIENKVKGYGWKVIGMYKVQDNGRLSQTDYRKTVYGGGYMDYWFESDGHLIGFHHGDTDGKSYNKTEWFYDAVSGFIMRGSASQSMQNRYMQVLLLTKTESNYLQMHTLQKLGDATDENGNLKPFYGMVVYQRMTDNELEATKKAYGYDANVNYTIDSEHNIHAIFTSDYNTNGRKIGNVKIISNSIKEEVKESEPGKSTSESIHVDSKDEVVFVLNGNVVPYSSVKEVPSSKIVSMNVIKNKKDPDYIKYAKNAKLPPKCIILVTTK